MLISKISIVASIVLFGYNLSMLLNRYVSFCEKALKYREILQQEKIALQELRNSNIRLSFGVAVIYITLLHFSGFATWLLGAIAFKFLLSLYFSDAFQSRVVDGRSISQKLYWAMKLDSLVNLLGATLIAYVLVS